MSLTPSRLFHLFIEELKSSFYSSLLCRLTYGYARYQFFRCLGPTRFLSTPDRSIPNTAEYNLQALVKFPLADFVMPRMHWLINAAYAIPDINAHSRVLIIGPRSENDLFLLKSRKARYIKALDLISYSPLVTLGDMHEIPFPDNSFDLIIIGWTLPYSSCPEVVIDELKRVASPRSFICIGLEHIKNYEPFKDVADGNSVHEHEISFERVHRLNEFSQLESLLASSFSSITPLFSYNHMLSDLTPGELVSRTGLSSSQVMSVHCCLK